MKNKKIKNKNQGFTLAEILITLAIIGIVASITIPTLIKSYNDIQYRTSWKRVISEVNQFYTLAKVEGYVFEKYGTSDSKFTVLGNYLNAQIKCNGSGDTVGKCWANNINSINLTTDSTCTFFNAHLSTRSGFVTNDGMYWIIYNSLWPIVAVDLNGSKGPNKWGDDILTFTMENDHIKTPYEGSPNYGYCIDSTEVPNNSLNYLTNN